MVSSLFGYNLNLNALSSIVFVKSLCLYRLFIFDNLEILYNKVYYGTIFSKKERESQFFCVTEDHGVSLR